MPWFWIMIGLLFLLLGGLLLTIAPWVPTKKEDLETIHQISDLKPGETWLEIGSGTGRVARYMAQKNPKNLILGLEILWILWLWSQIQNTLSPRPKPHLLWRNVFWYDVSRVDVIYVFSFPKALKGSFGRYLIKNTNPGTKLISYAFPLPDSKDHEKIVTAPSGHKIYVYHF